MKNTAVRRNQHANSPLNGCNPKGSLQENQILREIAKKNFSSLKGQVELLNAYKLKQVKRDMPACSQILHTAVFALGFRIRKQISKKVRVEGTPNPALTEAQHLSGF